MQIDVEAYIDQRCSTDVVSDALEGKLQGVAKKSSVELLVREICQQLRKDVREITGSLLVLCLLFGKETCEGENVGIDLLASGRAHWFIVRSHVELCYE